jgi:hypothetical protein
MIQLELRQEEDNSTLGLCTYNQDCFRKAKPAKDAEATDDMRPRWVGQPPKWTSTPKRWRDAIPRQICRPRYGSLGWVLGFGDPSKLPKAPLDLYF